MNTDYVKMGHAKAILDCWNADNQSTQNDRKDYDDGKLSDDNEEGYNKPKDNPSVVSKPKTKRLVKGMMFHHFVYDDDESSDDLPPHDEDSIKNKETPFVNEDKLKPCAYSELQSFQKLQIH